VTGSLRWNKCVEQESGFAALRRANPVAPEKILHL
jgi:hypothetical protein